MEIIPSYPSGTRMDLCHSCAGGGRRIRGQFPVNAGDHDGGRDRVTGFLLQYD